MIKEFIPYEQASELKELGFDEPCFGYYEPNGNFGYVESHIIKDMPYLAKNSEWQDLCSAPTFSQAFRWFREKHNFKSWVEEYNEENFIYQIRPHILTHYKEGEVYVYTIYEETELACLNKLIEIVKTK